MVAVILQGSSYSPVESSWISQYELMTYSNLNCTLHLDYKLTLF